MVYFRTTPSTNAKRLIENKPLETPSTPTFAFQQHRHSNSHNFYPIRRVNIIIGPSHPALITILRFKPRGASECRSSQTQTVSQKRAAAQNTGRIPLATGDPRNRRHISLAAPYVFAAEGAMPLATKLCCDVQQSPKRIADHRTKRNRSHSSRTQSARLRTAARAMSSTSAKWASQNGSIRNSIPIRSTIPPCKRASKISPL